MSNKKNILVIGGSGFIGSFLIKRLLDQNNNVINFDKHPSNISSSSLKTVIGDVKNIDNFSNLPKDIAFVYVLAAVHKDDISDHNLYYDTNHFGMINILNYCSEISVNNIIFFSSAAVYGNNFSNASEESKNLNPENDYGKSKVLAEKELNNWFLDKINRKVTIIRPSVVYGKGSKSNMNRMIDHISRGRFIMVGSGDNLKTVCYVENLVNFTIYIQSESIDSYGVYNYADFPHYKMKTLVNEISKIVKKRIISIPYFLAFGIGLFFDLNAKIMRRKFNMSSDRVRKFCSDTSLSTEKIEALDYIPRYNLVESINKSIK